MNEKYRTLSEAEGGDVETRSGGITANSPDISFELLVLLPNLREPPNSIDSPLSSIDSRTRVRAVEDDG